MPPPSKYEWVTEGFRQLRLLLLWRQCADRAQQLQSPSAWTAELAALTDQTAFEWLPGSCAWLSKYQPSLVQLADCENAFRERWPLAVRELSGMSDAKQRAAQQQKSLEQCLVESLQPAVGDLKTTRVAASELEQPVGTLAIWRTWREQAIALQTWERLQERWQTLQGKASIVRPWVKLHNECKHAISSINEDLPSTGVWSMLATISAPAQTSQLRQLQALLSRCAAAFHDVPDELGSLLHNPGVPDIQHAYDSINAELQRCPNDWPPAVLARWARTHQLDLSQVLPTIDSQTKLAAADWQKSLEASIKSGTDRYTFARLGGLRTMVVSWSGNPQPLAELVTALTPPDWEWTLLDHTARRFPHCVEEQPVRAGESPGLSQLGLRIKSPTGSIVPFPKAKFRVAPPLPPIIDRLQTLLEMLPDSDVATLKYGQNLQEMWQHVDGQLAEWWNPEDERCRDLWHFVQRISLWRLREPSYEIAVAGFFAQLGEQGFRLGYREKIQHEKSRPWCIVPVATSSAPTGLEPLAWGPTLVGPDQHAIAPAIVLALPVAQVVETPLAECMIDIEPMLHAVYQSDPKWECWTKTTPAVWTIWQGIRKAKGRLDPTIEAAALQLMQMFYERYFETQDRNYARLAQRVETALREMQVDVGPIYVALEASHPPPDNSWYGAACRLRRAHLPAVIETFIAEVRDAHFRGTAIADISGRVRELLDAVDRTVNWLEPMRPLATMAGIELLPRSLPDGIPPSWDDLADQERASAQVAFDATPAKRVMDLLHFGIRGSQPMVWGISAGHPELVEPWREACGVLQRNGALGAGLLSMLMNLPRRCLDDEGEIAVTEIMIEYWERTEPAFRQAGKRTDGLDDGLHTMMSAFQLQEVRPASIHNRAEYDNISDRESYRNIMTIVRPGIRRTNGQIIVKAKVTIE